MAYDDLKRFNGQEYTGMPVGGQHAWLYPDGRWREQKVAPDRWEFTFTSMKRREQSAPVGSGAPSDTLYHWYILAHQRVRKIDQDSYSTFMAGVKYKLAHKRPHWSKWSSEYPEQESERERIITILETTLACLREEASATESMVAAEP